MNVEIGAEAALFPEKEYISGVFVAVWTAWAATAPLHRKGLLSETKGHDVWQQSTRILWRV